MKGMFAGLVGGLVGTWAMTWAQKGWMRIEEQVGEDENYQSSDSNDSDDEAPATVKVAEKVSEAVRDRGLTNEEEAVAGQLMHYSMGATSGAIYGMTAEMLPIASIGFGLPFGALLFVVSDEVVVPATGLSEPPSEIPPEVHARGLVAHLAYGLVTDLTRRAILATLEE